MADKKHPFNLAQECSKTAMQGLRVAAFREHPFDATMNMSRVQARAHPFFMAMQEVN